MKLLDLFSGIGGFSLGLESTGYFKTIAFCEKDEFCQKVLRKHWKYVPIESEIRNVKGSNYEADIITGGFPCQPFSVAGKRKGTNDDRYLWDETIRVIRETKPRWFIGENVEGIINIQDGMVLRQVQNDLEEQGFQVQCLVIPASGIGAWHQRKRIWIIANTKHNGSYTPKRNETIKSSNQSEEWLFVGDDRFNVSNTPSEGLQGFWDTYELQEIRKKIKTNREGNDGTRQSWWQTQSRICGVPHGVSFELDKDRNNRIKSLGNSIVPLIARQLGLAIIEAEHDNQS
jgi:DNA (cytosine-5)-methyltransferase 1